MSPDIELIEIKIGITKHFIQRKEVEFVVAFFEIGPNSNLTNEMLHISATLKSKEL